MINLNKRSPKPSHTYLKIILLFLHSNHGYETIIIKLNLPPLVHTQNFNYYHCKVNDHMYMSKVFLSNRLISLKPKIKICFFKSISRNNLLPYSQTFSKTTLSSNPPRCSFFCNLLSNNSSSVYPRD